jgi:hypothetical protein
MDAALRFIIGLRLVARRHSARVWLLWALAALLLVLTPFALIDAAAWVFVLDPELAAIAVLIGLATIRGGALRLLRTPVQAVARLPRRR